MSRRGKGCDNRKDESKKGNPKPLRRMETREIGLKTIPGQAEEKSTIVRLEYSRAGQLGYPGVYVIFSFHIRWGRKS